MTTNEPPCWTAWWLIEVGSPALYYCPDESWCSNPNHAEHFLTHEAALERRSTLSCMMEPRVVEHLWVNGDWHWHA